MIAMDIEASAGGWPWSCAPSASAPGSWPNRSKKTRRPQRIDLDEALLIGSTHAAYLGDFSGALAFGGRRDGLTRASRGRGNVFHAAAPSVKKSTIPSLAAVCAALDAARWQDYRYFEDRVRQNT
jgi:hypothetical protein